jgi:small subunit ribosomal protein S8
MYAERRAEIVRQLRDREIPYEERLMVCGLLRRLPRDSAAVRYRNVCSVTGRSRAYYRAFGVSRIVLRREALSGNIPGLFKGSL